MNIIKIMHTRNYRTEVLVDGKFAYQTGIYRDEEANHLRHLIALLGLEDSVVITIGEEE